MEPTLAGFIAFIRQDMDIDTTVLPDGSAAIETAYRLSCHTVSTLVRIADRFLYARAIYNLGGDFLINIAPDQSDSPTFGQPPLKFFANARREFNTLGWVGGVISSASDNSTSESMVVPKALENLTISDLQRLKTPYGRAYLEIAQQGGTLWGLS